MQFHLIHQSGVNAEDEEGTADIHFMMRKRNFWSFIAFEIDVHSFLLKNMCFILWRGLLGECDVQNKSKSWGRQPKKQRQRLEGPLRILLETDQMVAMNLIIRLTSIDELGTPKTWKGWKVYSGLLFLKKLFDRLEVFKVWRKVSRE